MTEFAGAPTRTLTLISSDGARFDVNENFIGLSSYAKAYAEENPDGNELMVPIVDSQTFQKIFEYTNQYEIDPMKEVEKVNLNAKCLIFFLFFIN
jgi:hypothetical protein